MREEITAAMKQAMRDKSAVELSTLRLVNAAIKDRDIAARSEGNPEGVDDDEILALLAKMVKQRQESAKAFEEAGRLELAEKERAEIVVIQGFMPRQMDADEVTKAIKDVILDLGAEGPKDMGRVMAALKNRYAGQMDFSKASAAVKSALSA
ncbi:MAG: GatB/YqeY domain-containing protein [Pseudomonadota bacterium]